MPDILAGSRARRRPPAPSPRPALSNLSAGPALSKEELTAARPTREASVAGDDVSSRQGHARDAPDGEAVKWIVSGARMQCALVDGLRGRGVEQQEVGIAAHGEGALARVETADPRGSG